MNSFINDASILLLCVQLI